jgi:hypothetical protein
VTIVDGLPAAAVLIGLVLNATVGAWWPTRWPDM